MNYFPIHYSSSGSQVPRPYPGSSGHKAVPSPGQDSHRRIHSHLQLHSPDWDNVDMLIHLTSLHTFGMWEETRVPRENPQRHEENMPTSQSGHDWEITCFFFFFLQCYNKMK